MSLYGYTYNYIRLCVYNHIGLSIVIYGHIETKYMIIYENIYLGYQIQIIIN